MSGVIQVSNELLFSTSLDSSLIYSSGLAPVTHLSVETNHEDGNLSLAVITTPNLLWKGIFRISLTSTISRPRFRSEDNYEVLSVNGGHQILRWVDPSTLTSASSFSSPLPEPLQPVGVTDDTATVITAPFAATVAT